ncbi:MAG: hypothetical protein PVI10_11915, partial [Methyloceanibacter sp.]
YFALHLIGFVGVMPERSMPFGVVYNSVITTSVQSQFLPTSTGCPTEHHNRREHMLHSPHDEGGDN